MGNSVSEIAILWDRALKKIQEILSETSDKIVYDSFFASSYIDSVNGNVINVVVNSKTAVQVLTASYKDVVDAVLKEVTQSNFDVVFIAEEDVQKIDLMAAQKPTKPAYFADARINKDYRFDNFIVGPSNLEAHQAAVICSRNPGKLYNPILIYGDSGLGKTHLLHAIGNAINERFPTMRVLYVTAQDFFNEYVKFVQGDKEGNNIVDWFKTSVDILLIDDVQFLVNKQKTEETFFAIYNSFYAAGKQVVLTADQHPAKLNGLDERLKSRFVQGLPLSINAPEKETCESILKLRIQAAGLDANDFAPEVISYFADKFRKNVRELEGALDRLLFYIVNIYPTKYVDLETAMSSVQSLVDVQEDQTRLSEEKIINVVADYYNLAPYQLTGRIRTAQIAMARHIAMYLIRDMLDVPFTKIGRMFGGKDHATVMNGVNKVENQLKIDKSLEKAISDLHKRLDK